MRNSTRETLCATAPHVKSRARNLLKKRGSNKKNFSPNPQDSAVERLAACELSACELPVCGLSSCALAVCELPVYELPVCGVSACKLAVCGLPVCGTPTCEFLPISYRPADCLLAVFLTREAFAAPRQKRLPPRAAATRRQSARPVVVETLDVLLDQIRPQLYFYYLEAGNGLYSMLAPGLDYYHVALLYLGKFAVQN